MHDVPEKQALTNGKLRNSCRASCTLQVASCCLLAAAVNVARKMRRKNGNLHARTYKRIYVVFGV